MAQRYCRRYLVHVLAAWAPRPSENLFELGLKETELFHPLLNRPAHRHAWHLQRRDVLAAVTQDTGHP